LRHVGNDLLGYCLLDLDDGLLSLLGVRKLEGLQVLVGALDDAAQLREADGLVSNLFLGPMDVVLDLLLLSRGLQGLVGLRRGCFL